MTEENGSFVSCSYGILGNPLVQVRLVANLLARILVEEYSVGKANSRYQLFRSFSSSTVILLYLRKRSGSIIFIDEAYTLLSSPEAISSMVESMDPL